MTAKPLFDNVVIELKDALKQNDAGIHLPDNKDEVNEGTVVATGGGVDLAVAVQGIGGMTTLARQQMQVKIGDYVIFKKYAGIPFTLNKKDVVAINQKDILTIIEK